MALKTWLNLCFHDSIKMDIKKNMTMAVVMVVV